MCKHNNSIYKYKVWVVPDALGINYFVCFIMLGHECSLQCICPSISPRWIPNYSGNIQQPFASGVLPGGQMYMLPDPRPSPLCYPPGNWQNTFTSPPNQLTALPYSEMTEESSQHPVESQGIPDGQMYMLPHARQTRCGILQVIGRIHVLLIQTNLWPHHIQE